MTHTDTAALWMQRRRQRTACSDVERLARMVSDNETIEDTLRRCQYHADLRKAIDGFDEKAMDWLCSIIALGIAQKNVGIARDTLDVKEARN